MRTTTSAVKIDAIFDTARRTAARESELGTLAADLMLLNGDLIHCFIDDEVAVQLLRATYGSTTTRRVIRESRLRKFEWCALYPVPRTGFMSIARRYGPGARNVIVLGTAARPSTVTKPHVDDDESDNIDHQPWQHEEVTIYIGEKVILFPTTKGAAAEAPKDLTETYLKLGLRGVLDAVDSPPLDSVFFNPRQKDLADYNHGRLLERILAGTFAP